MVSNKSTNERAMAWIVLLAVAIGAQKERNYEFMKKRYLEHKIIPDCLDDVPKHHLQVEFYKRVVDYGSVISMEEMADPPSCLRWPVGIGELYSMAFVGLDCPLREISTEKEFQHFLVINIPGTGEDFCYAEYPTMYVGMNPVYEPGSHRFVLTVYKQPKKIEWDGLNITNTFISRARANFSTRGFAEKYNLGKPYAGNFFLVNQNESIEVPDHQDHISYDD